MVRGGGGEHGVHETGEEPQEDAGEDEVPELELFELVG